MSKQLTSTPDASIVTWDALVELPVQAGLRRKSIAGLGMMLMRVEFEQGAVVAAHRHEEEQFTLVLSGCLRFLVGEPGTEEEVVAHAGSVVHCLGNVLHSAEALEATVEVDVFTPVREELLAPSAVRLGT